jgi:hypothetical protein
MIRFKVNGVDRSFDGDAENVYPQASRTTTATLSMRRFSTRSEKRGRRLDCSQACIPHEGIVLLWEGTAWGRRVIAQQARTRAPEVA